MSSRFTGQKKAPQCPVTVLLLLMQLPAVNSHRYWLNLPSSPAAPLKSPGTINFNPLIAYAQTRTSSSVPSPPHSTPFCNHVGHPSSGSVISDRFSLGFISGAGMWPTWHVNNILGIIYSSQPSGLQRLQAKQLLTIAVYTLCTAYFFNIVHITLTADNNLVLQINN